MPDMHWQNCKGVGGKVRRLNSRERGWSELMFMDPISGEPQAGIGPSWCCRSELKPTGRANQELLVQYFPMSWAHSSKVLRNSGLKSSNFYTNLTPLNYSTVFMDKVHHILICFGRCSPGCSVYCRIEPWC